MLSRRKLLDSCLLLSFVFATRTNADGPVPVHIVHDPEAPTCYSMTLISAYDSDGQPMTFEPAEKPAFDEQLMALSVGDAMARLDDLAGLEQPFVVPRDIRQRADDYACLASIVAAADTAGLKRLRALVRLLQEYEAVGGSAIEFESSLAVTHPFELTRLPLSSESAQLLERFVRLRLEGGLPASDSKLASAARELSSASDEAHFCTRVIERVLHSGCASPQFLAWVRELYLAQLEEYLYGEGGYPFGHSVDLRMFARDASFDRAHVRRILNLLAPAIFLGSEDRRSEVAHLLECVSELPAFTIDEATQTLSLLEEAERINRKWKSSIRKVGRKILDRFGVSWLDGAAPVPQDVKKEAIRRERPRRNPERQVVERVHLRWTRFGFRDGQEPVELESFATAVDSPGWPVLGCGAAESWGSIYVRFTGAELDWRYETGSTIWQRGEFQARAGSPIHREALECRVYDLPWASRASSAGPRGFDLLVLELSVGPFKQASMPPDALRSVLIEAVRRTEELAPAVLRWVAQRPPEVRRSLLSALCRDPSDYTPVAAADLLLDAGDLEAFEELIDGLVEASPATCLPTPLMRVFRFLADREEVPQQTKNRWAAEMVRRHLNGPLGDWKATAIMSAVTELTGRSFGYQPQKAAAGNLDAIKAAQDWAWQAENTPAEPKDS